MSSLPNESAGTRKTVLLLMLVVACGHFNRVGISVAGTERIIPDYGITPTNMGWVYSAFLISYTLAMLPGGWFIDRFGPRLALVLLGFGSALFVALTGFVGLAFHEATGLFLGLLVVRSLLGMVYAPLHPGSARMVADQLPPQARPQALGWVNFSACLGIAATQLVLGAMIDRFDWPVALLISSAMTLAVALAWVAGTRDRGMADPLAVSRSPTQVDRQVVWRVLRQSSVIAITLSYAAYGYFQYLFFYWITYYFETVRQQDHVLARLHHRDHACDGCRHGLWWLADEPGARTLLALGQARPRAPPGNVRQRPGLRARLGGLEPAGHAGAFILSAAFLGVCEAAFWITAVELGGQYGGTAAGLMNTGGNAGGAISPFLTPFLSDLIARQYGDDLGWRLALALAGVIVFAGGALWFMIHPAAKAESILGVSGP